MHSPNYPIHLHWSEEDGEWAATSPAWPALSALDEDPRRALSGLRKAIALATSANREAGRPVPEAMTVDDLRLAGSVLKIASLASLAGIPAQTLHSKIRRGGTLAPHEAAALHNALAGVRLAVVK
jgi:predicted RNase H-like HicB family nuclease